MKFNHFKNIILIIISLYLTACGAGVSKNSNGNFNPDNNISLKIISVSPANGAINIKSDTLISISFDKAMNTSTINHHTVFLISSKANIPLSLNNISHDKQSFTFTHKVLLEEKTQYSIEIAANHITDLKGNKISSQEKLEISKFTTFDSNRDLPIISTYPANGSHVALTDYRVESEHLFEGNIIFNKDIDSNTLNKDSISIQLTDGVNNINVIKNFFYNNKNKTLLVTISSKNGLIDNKNYQIIIKPNLIKDKNGNHIGSNNKAILSSFYVIKNNDYSNYNISLNMSNIQIDENINWESKDFHYYSIGMGTTDKSEFGSRWNKPVVSYFLDNSDIKNNIKNYPINIESFNGKHGIVFGLFHGIEKNSMDPKPLIKPTSCLIDSNKITKNSNVIINLYGNLTAHFNDTKELVPLLNNLTCKIVYNEQH